MLFIEQNELRVNLKLRYYCPGTIQKILRQTTQFSSFSLLIIMKMCAKCWAFHMTKRKLMLKLITNWECPCPDISHVKWSESNYNGELLLKQINVGKILRRRQWIKINHLCY